MIRLAKAQIMTAAGHDCMMQLEEFLKFCITHPNLLKRAYSVQMKLQDEICGRPFWESLTKRRRKMTRLNNEVIDWQNIDEIIEGFVFLTWINGSSCEFIERFLSWCWCRRWSLSSYEFSERLICWCW